MFLKKHEISFGEYVSIIYLAEKADKSSHCLFSYSFNFLLLNTI